MNWIIFDKTSNPQKKMLWWPKSVGTVSALRTSQKKIAHLSHCLILLLTIVLSACSREISDSQTQNFIKFFGGGQNAEGFDMVEVPDGYIFAGFNTTTQFKKQVYVVKTDKAGNTLWARQYGTAQADEAVVVKPFNDDIYLLCNSKNDITSLTTSYLLKLNSKGDSLTSFPFGEATYSLVLNDFLVDESSIYVVGESYQNSPTQSDYFFGRYDHLGSPVWEPKTFTSSGNQVFSRAFHSSNGNIIAVGTNSAVIGSGYTHIAMVEFTSQGLPIYNVNLPSAANYYFGDAFLHDNHLVIAYNTISQGNFTAEVVCVSASSYQLVWQAEASIDKEIKALTKGSDGTIAVFAEQGAQIHLYQLNEQGHIILSNDEVKSMLGYVGKAISTSDKGWAFIGTTAPEYGTMMQVVKTDANLFLFEQ